MKYKAVLYTKYVKLACIRVFFTITMILGSIMTLLIQGCDSPPTPLPLQETQFTKLNKTWKLDSATLDNKNQSGYENFTYTVTGSANSSSFKYSTTGRPDLSPWLGSGTWSFGNNIGTTIVRDPDTDDELNITYSVTDTKLRFSFIFAGTGYANGRVAEVKGQWVFNFKIAK